ncbi:MAG: DUF4956 domain-containing protein [Eggerthellaceae bacterium]
MFDFFFTSVLGATNSTAATITSSGFFACTIASIILGLCAAIIYMYHHNYSKNFVVTLALLPVIVQMVILLVNGNLGAGIAVMGVFNLVRFRSIAGTAKDIGSVFLAMAIGLACGMGYIGIAILLTVVVALFNLIYVKTGFGASKNRSKHLVITVPDNFDYEGVFDEILSRYTSSYELNQISTANMGSLYRLEYQVLMADSGLEKKMLDELRCFNGNLKISLGLAPLNSEVL